MGGCSGGAVLQMLCIDGVSPRGACIAGAAVSVAAAADSVCSARAGGVILCHSFGFLSRP